MTAGFVLDFRNVPNVGKYVMFFHASKKGFHPETHGAASIGIAWSDDLEHWSWPPAESPGMQGLSKNNLWCRRPACSVQP